MLMSSWLRAIVRVHPVHLMNADWAPGGWPRKSNHCWYVAKQRGAQPWAERKIASVFNEKRSCRARRTLCMLRPRGAAIHVHVVWPERMMWLLKHYYIISTVLTGPEKSWFLRGLKNQAWKSPEIGRCPEKVLIFDHKGAEKSVRLVCQCSS